MQLSETMGDLPSANQVTEAIEADVFSRCLCKR